MACTSCNRVELLMVISIICLVMAITLPALNSGREQGKRVACLSNRRNLTQGGMMYALDNDDLLCSANPTETVALQSYPSRFATSSWISCMACSMGSGR